MILQIIVWLLTELSWELPHINNWNSLSHYLLKPHLYDFHISMAAAEYEEEVIFGIKTSQATHQPVCKERWMIGWQKRRRLLEITTGQSWHGVCVHECACHSSIASACVLGKWKVTDIVWHCESCRFLSIIPHQGHIHRLKVVALAFSTPGSGRGMGPADHCCF